MKQKINYKAIIIGILGVGILIGTMMMVLVTFQQQIEISHYEAREYCDCMLEYNSENMCKQPDSCKVVKCAEQYPCYMDAVNILA